MKREHTDKEDEDQQQTKRDSNRRDSQESKNELTDKKPKLDASSLDLKDLGAGYEAEDRKLIRAINIYETKLLPYIEEHSSLFKRSNFLSLKGYATGITENNSLTSSDH